MNISILGSTGSIGRQALEVVENLGLNVVALTGFSNVALLKEQAARFKPDLVMDSSHGMAGLEAAASHPKADVVVNALVGNVGFLPTVAAISAGKTVALANKEVLVCGGEVIMSLARNKGVDIVPVDSEHSAVFQCLNAKTPHQVRGDKGCAWGDRGQLWGDAKVYLTASGGPFRGWKREDMADISPAQALKHPNWSMGAKISIDSATMMNKGLEVIEAYWLFDISAKQIEVLVHPQSIIHSMVEFADGQILAQLGAPDMRHAIQYALTHPKRLANNFDRLDFAKHNSLTFEKPDTEAFPCLRLAYEALERGGLYPTVLNAANEAAVAQFLNGQIGFLGIPAIIENTLSAYTGKNKQVSIESILSTEQWAKSFAEKR